MKILQRYILREHIAPFFFALFIITFLLIIEFVPKIVDQVIDKDISVWVVLELIGLNLAWMLALSVPMSVLVATLMAFGRLTSDFEITAIKSSGINLLHLLIPLLIAASILTGVMIWFSDAILPDLNRRARILSGDISAMRPTLVFRSGVFITEVPGYLVQLDHVDHATSRVEGVRITETKNPTKPRLIIAEYGFLKAMDNGRNLQFTLYNGEVHSLDLENPANYRKVDFANQVINIGGTGSELVRTNSSYRTDREMPIDTMRQQVMNNLEQMEPLKASSLNSLKEKFTYLFSDSFKTQSKAIMSDSTARVSVQTDAMVLMRTLERNVQQLESRQRAVAKFQIEIYKKYSIPAASLAFVLIGAPLAIMTRKGGMGLAISISILLFIVYWAFLIGGEDMADRGVVSPFWAMWSANILMTILGIYLIYVVVSEKPIFSFFRRVQR
jgi:lipopolysaccharide export system permease protein